MLVGDLIYNDNFDCNCNYAIYDCTEGGVQWDEAKIIHSTIQHGYSKPKDAILDMKIKYITTSDNSRYNGRRLFISYMDDSELLYISASAESI